ncbi:MAG: hypothetical protein JWQ89_4151 [Devosia sp.]|uniref:DUF6456 domain-containing protein n=1 Tax=Devosia sp. TaxID=1871048 RepID=UPI00262C9877|nr:DUF6456 domain-containing protein [Devosia sp.]MDB5542424.1 hypothetical protein [Devosia sp.]
MQRPSKAALRFVRALLGEGRAVRDAELFSVAGADGRSVSLSVHEVRELASLGVLDADGGGCGANAGTAQWLKRQMLDEDAFAAQHRLEARQADGAMVNLAESPLARLAAAAGEGEAFLRPHQVEAGERVRRLVERAQLQPRLTMSYSAAHTAGKGAGRAGDIGDMAADARKALADLHRQLPRDCAEVVLDVCGFGKGLQHIETERGWPRRSAKLVLRIGLDRLAEVYGLGEVATGAETRRRRAWMEGGGSRCLGEESRSRGTTTGSATFVCFGYFGYCV